MTGTYRSPTDDNPARRIMSYMYARQNGRAKTLFCASNDAVPTSRDHSLVWRYARGAVTSVIYAAML